MRNTAPAVPADDAAWPAQSRAARISMRPLTAVLTVVLIATVAVLAGARLEQRERGSVASGTRASAFSAAGFGRNRAGATAGTGAAGGASAITTGTVTEITRKLLYLTSSTGALVKIELTPKTTFTRMAGLRGRHQPRRQRDRAPVRRRERRPRRDDRDRHREGCDLDLRRRGRRLRRLPGGGTGTPGG